MSEGAQEGGYGTEKALEIHTGGNARWANTSRSDLTK